MQPEERQLLDRILRLTEQNNRMLRSMKRAVVIGRVMHAIYWIIIVGISVASYYYIKPYLGSLSSAVQVLDQVKGLY